MRLSPIILHKYKNLIVVFDSIIWNLPKFRISEFVSYFH